MGLLFGIHNNLPAPVSVSIQDSSGCPTPAPCPPVYQWTSVQTLCNASFYSIVIAVIKLTRCKKCGVTERPRGAIFSCFCGNSMGYHGNMKILLPWGVPIHHIFYSEISRDHIATTCM